MNGNLRPALALAAGMILSAMVCSWAFLRAKRLDQTIEVTGSFKKRIRSDLIIWRTSVISEAPSLADAYGKLTRDVEKVRAFLVANGLPAGQLVISAVETTTIRRGRREGYEEGGEALSGAVTGYHLKQSLGIRSTEMDKVTIVSRKVTELINQGILLESEAPQYLYTRLAEIKVEILAEAARDALARSQQIASSTGSRIGEMRSADMGVLQITAADSTEISGYGVNDTTSLEKDVTAVVHVRFALR